MKTLEKPRFRDLPQGECAEAPILRKLWDHFDFSYLLTQSGIFKQRGVPTWLLSFMYVMGLIAQCSSRTRYVKTSGKRCITKAYVYSLADSAAHFKSFFNCKL